MTATVTDNRQPGLTPAHVCYWLLLACVPASMLATGNLLGDWARPFFATYLKYFVCQTLLALAAVAAALWWVGSRRTDSDAKRRPAWPAFAVVLGAYAAWAALSYVWSPWRYGTQGYVIRELWLYALCIGFFWAFPSRRRWHVFALVFALAAMAAAVWQLSAFAVSIWQSRGPLSDMSLFGLLRSISRKRSHLWFLYGNANFSCSQSICAGLILLGFGLAGVKALWKAGVSGRRRLWIVLSVVGCGLGIAICVWLLAVAGSTAGYVAAAVGVAAYAMCVLPVPKRGHMAGGLLAVIGICMVLMLGVPQVRGRIIERIFAGESTTQARAVWWLATVDIYLSSPLIGRGVGSYASLYYRFAPPLADHSSVTRFIQATHPHNEPLRVVAELGLVGLGLYVSMLGIALVTSYRAIRKRDFMGRTVGFALWAGALAYIVQASLGKAVMGWDFALGYWMLLGLLASAFYRREDRPRRAWRPSHMTRRSLGLLALAVAAIALCWWGWGLRSYRSMVRLREANVHHSALKYLTSGGRHKETAQIHERALTAADGFREGLARAEVGSLWPTRILLYHYAAGAVIYRLGRTSEALEEFLWADEAAPGFLDGQRWIGMCYLQLNDRQKAFEYLDRFVLSHPTVTAGYWDMARVDLRAAGKRLLDQVSKGDGFRNPERVGLAGRFLADLRRWDAVEGLLQRTAELGGEASLKALGRELESYCTRAKLTDRLEELRRKFPAAFEAPSAGQRDEPG